jgi:Flp pilus assembly protein TadG
MAGGEVRRPRAGERGAAAVEFALVVPVLLLLVFGIIGYGYLLSFRQALSQAAAEGARAAAVQPAGTSPTVLQSVMAAAVNEALDSYGVRCAGTALQHEVDGTWQPAGTCDLTTPACPGNTTVTCASVALSYTYGDDPLTPDVPLVPLPGTLSYRTSVEIN